MDCTSASLQGRAEKAYPTLLNVPLLACDHGIKHRSSTNRTRPHDWLLPCPVSPLYLRISSPLSNHLWPFTILLTEWHRLQRILRRPRRTHLLPIPQFRNPHPLPRTPS